MADPISICNACGVVRPTETAACTHCGSADAAVVTNERADGTSWVCIECTFKCRMCGFRVPLNSLDMDGAVVCARCELEQAFDVTQWTTALDGAHGTADLWGHRGSSFAEHYGHIYEDIGKTTSSLVFNAPGESSLQATASPGRPLCHACRAPIDVDVDLRASKDGRATVKCACGETATYEAPEPARAMSSLKIVVGSEHRTDRRAVKVDATDSAISVRCPGCNAPLQADETSKFLTCNFCHTQARIPDRTWFRISKKEHVPEPMWLLFHGLSKARIELLKRQSVDKRNRREGELALERTKEKLAKKAREDEARDRERVEDERKRKLRDEERAAAEILEAQRRKDEEKSEARAKIVGIGVLVLGALGAAGYGIHEDAEKAKRRAPFEACERGNGKVCDDIGEYDSACNANYFPGCMHAAEAAAKNGNSWGVAVDDYDKACRGGYAPACEAVEAYVLTPKVDIGTRLGHYEKQCDAGKLAACDSAGLLYANANGNGLGRDVKRAITLYEKACNGGVAAGCDLLKTARASEQTKDAGARRSR